MQKRTLPKEYTLEEQTKAAQKLQNFYRAYRTAKFTKVKKEPLLEHAPDQKEEKTKSDPVAQLANFACEKTALFLHTNLKTKPVLFNQKGWQTLFPIDQKATTTNIKLLEHYLNARKETRKWTLEAYLRGRIDKHALMTLFQLQQMVTEFLHDAKQDCTVKLYPVHQKGLTKEAEVHLMRQLTVAAPRYVTADLARTVAFKQKLTENLTALPPVANHFAVMTVPIEKIYKIAFLLMIHFNLYAKEPLTQDLEDFLQDHRNFFHAVATKLGIQHHRVEHPGNYYQKIWDKVTTLIFRPYFSSDNEFANTMKSPRLLKNFINENGHYTLYAANIFNAQRTFMPVYLEQEDRFVLVLYGSEIQNAMLATLTDKTPEAVLKKAAMFGTIPVRTFHRFTTQGTRIIGLELPDSDPIPVIVHGCTAKSGSYTGHDQLYHFPVEFCVRVFAEPIVHLLEKLVSLLQSETGFPISDVITHVLDFANEFFYFQYTGKELTLDEMGQNIGLVRQKHKSHAQREYALLAAVDILKNLATYETELRKMPHYANHPAEKLQVLMMDGVMVEEGMNECIRAYKHHLAQWPRTLCVWMMHIAFNVDIDEEQFSQLGAKIKTLMEKGNIELKWSMNFGLMLNIDQYSFRFRSHKRSEDHRIDFKYPEDGKIRINSTDPDWFGVMVKLIEDKLTHTQDQSKPVQVIAGKSR